MTRRMSCSSMRLFVVGHTYLTPFAQSKYVAMKQLDPTLRLRIASPPRMSHPFMEYGHSRHPGLSDDETMVIPVIFGQSHMTYVLHPGALWTALKKFDATHIHIEEDPHSLAGAETTALARLACPRASISFFIWDNLARRPHFPVNVVKAALTWSSLHRASLVVCGNTEAEHLLKTVKKYCGRTAVLPQLGLDPVDYEAPPSASVRALLPSGEPWIGYLGRLVPEKGVLVLLEALQRLRHLPWRLLMVGNGPLKAEIDAHWKPRFGPRMVCLDAVKHSEVPDYLKCLDVFVLPSFATAEWKEQFGLTLAQAMLAGTACIGTESGAIGEVLGDAGLKVPERDVSALSLALARFLCNEEDRNAFKAKARAFALGKYTNQIVAQKYLAAFASN
jgi:glycosyltransferase involved in cell wall biosynthesis